MVSIITISYNKSELLKECLNSIYKTLKGDFEVIVVDHNSQDESVAMVKHNFLKATVLDTKKNPGFGTGCNSGAAHARGDVLLFLNSDAEVLDNSIFEMEKYLLSDEKIGVVGGILENRDHTPQRSYSSFYDISHVVKLLFGGDRAELSSQNLKTIQPVDWVSGGFMMVKKEVFQSINGFDEKIFMYIEDMELCYRVKKAGYKVIFYPKARVYHLGQGSSNRSFAIIHIYHGLNYFYLKHKGVFEQIILKFLLRLKAYLVIIVATITRRYDLCETYKKALQF